MVASSQEFALQLERGPAVLLLGQLHLALDSGSDPLLDEIGRKYRERPLETYSEALGLGLESQRETAVAWMDEACRKLQASRQLEPVTNYPWSAVLTSGIDTVLTRVFRAPWRDVQPVFEERHRPADPRNRARLHLFYLFGNVNRSDAEARIPLTQFELLRRLQIATALTRRLPELVTPLGTLAIDAYQIGDWLPTEGLAPVLADLNPGQVHFFGTGRSPLATDPYIAELVTRGIAILHDASLSSVLAEATASGLLTLDDGHAGKENRQLRLGDRSIQIPAELWKRTRATATILDDQALVEPSKISPDALYRDFRAFLGAGDGKPNWEGHARGFAFKRSFEQQLEAAVGSALASPAQRDRPVILHGSTGSGKTIALAALARRVRMAHRFPVLHIERRAQQTSYSDLDAFCEWVEQAGAPATLIAWDGMLEAGDYFEALRYLNSRGRNVVLVGTAYRVLGDAAEGSHLISAPAQLSEGEQEGFAHFLSPFDGGLGDLVKERAGAGEAAFLVALYRMLPPVRGVVRAGVSREVRRAEESMAQAAENDLVTYSGGNPLAVAMRNAGLLGTGLSPDTAVEVGSEVVDDFKHLTGLVMVPGRFGLRVPLELLLRTLGHAGYEHFLELLEGVDIFRWYEDSAGNIEIGARSRLEAKLITEARTGGPETEAALVQELVLELRQDSSLSGGREVDFAVALLRAVGPGGHDPASFADFFVDFANTLQRARTERGVINPRLLLQESNLLREAAIDASRAQRWTTTEVGQSLDRAETVVREALELLPDAQRSRGLRSALLVELASTMGARATQLAGSGNTGTAEAAGIVGALRGVVAEARLQDPTSYHPVDVLAWATRNAVTSGVISGVAKVDAISDVLSAFETMEVGELDPVRAKQFHERRYQIGELIGDADLSADAHAELKRRGSGAAVFLQALRASGLAGSSEEQSPDQASIEAGVALLEGEPDLLWGDSRCLNLYLDLWWIARTGERPLAGERTAPPFQTEEWQLVLDVTAELGELTTTRRPTVLEFLRGLALFHLGRIPEAFTTFKNVERESMALRSRRRVVRTYVASTPDGQPRGYHGGIAWLDSTGRKGEIYVEELRRNVVFFPHDFRLDEPHLGRDMGDFRIAFNFLGPIVDPSHR